VEIVRKNFALKVLALALAIVGWAYFRLAGNPIVATTQLQQLSVPVTAVNLPLGLVARFGDHQAVVTVETKPGQAPVKPEEIKAVLNLADKAAGVYNVPVQLVAPDVAVQSLSPASVTLTVEKVEVKTFPITVHYVGQQPGIVVTYSAIGPDAAVVRAPTSLLTQVASVRAEIAMPDDPKSIDEMVRPIAVDAGGAPLPVLAVSPNLVRVQARFVAGTSPAR
jgi:YbbR domain-containing protein